MKNIAVFTSGGDAPGMNAAIRAVVRSGIKSGLNVYGIRKGYSGMIKGLIHPLDWHDVSRIINQGGTILHSARSTEFHTETGRAKAAVVLKEHDIEGIVAIGGDGTFTGAKQFLKEHQDFKIVGIPGTIDNDLYGTDSTIGYDTAINTAMRAIDKIKDTAIAHDRVFFIEVMGRDAGYIALRSGIATGAEAVLIPEYRTDIGHIVRMLKDKKGHSSIIVVAEGDDEGGAFEIAEKVKRQVDTIETRVTILGHIQRGGSPTCRDRVLASRLGLEAVKALLKDKSKIMIGERKGIIEEIPFSSSIKHTEQLNPTLIELVKTLN